MDTNELAAAYVAAFGPCTSVEEGWARSAYAQSYSNEDEKDYDHFKKELDAKAVRESAPKATDAQIAAWKARLPEDLTFGTFDADFRVDNGRYYRYGAWNTAGDWWLAWNTDDEFQKQIESCE